MFDITKYLEETITNLNGSIVFSLLASPSFNLESGSIVWWIFMICIVWQLTTIFVDFASNGSLDSKKILNTVVATIVVFYAYGKFNPRSVTGLDFGLSGTEYDYKGKKTLLRDTHAVFRKFFSEFAESVTSQNELTKGDVTQTLIDWTMRRGYTEAICNGVNGKKECIEENLKIPIADLKQKHLDNISCSIFPDFICEGAAFLKIVLTSPVAMGSVATSILGIIKMVLIVIVFVGYTIITVMSLVMLKIIFPFIILDRTRSSILTAIKFYLSTSAFVFVIKIFRFIIASITLGVVEALNGLEYTDSDTFVAKSVIGTMMIVAVVVIEVGMLFATPKLTQALFNLQLEVFTRITDELKSSALLIGSIFTGGVALAGASKVMGTNSLKGLKGGSMPGSNPGDGASRFGEKRSPYNSGFNTSKANNFSNNTSNTDKFDYVRRPFEDASASYAPNYSGGKEPDSVVDSEDLTENYRSDADTKTDDGNIKTNSDFEKSGENSNPSNTKEPKSVLQEDDNWDSFVSDLGNQQRKNRFSSENKKDQDKGSDKNKQDSDFYNKRKISKKDAPENLPSTLSTLGSDDSLADEYSSAVTKSFGNPADNIDPEVLNSQEDKLNNKKVDDIIDADWTELDQQTESENYEERENPDKKSIKIGKGVLTGIRMATDTLKWVTRLTSAAIDASSGNASGIDKFRDEITAIPTLGKRRSIAKQIVNNPDNNLSKRDFKILKDYLDINKHQRPEYKKRAENIIDSYESDLEFEDN